MSNYRAAVIGLGIISELHIAALERVSGVRLAAVCDVDPSRSEVAPGLPFYQDYVQMMAQEKPDCVHICLPHHLHYPAAVAAAEAGCHVFCEKPLALDAAQARDFARLEQEHPELKFGLCLQNRRNESVEALLELLSKGDPVTGVSATVHWHRPGAYYEEAPWRGRMSEAGGGAMINQAIHTLDLVRLLGGRVDSVMGSVSRLSGLEIEVEDTACARISFASGATGFFSCTVANGRNDSVTITVATQHGLYCIADGALYREEAEGGPNLLARDAKLPGAKSYYGASHAKLIDQFYRCLEQDSGEYIHAADGVAVMDLIDAIAASSETGRPHQL